MQLIATALALLPLTASAATTPKHAAAKSTKTLTTGAVAGNKANRYEIRYLRDNLPYQWNLYLAAVAKMQTMDQQDEMSWYGIMGIHGYPPKVWGGASKGGPGTGYCDHGVVTFPPWHRPYVALYEQQLSAIAVSIAATLTVDKDIYMSEATKLRAPFFDWGARGPYANEGAWPELLSGTTIVSNLTGTPTTIQNPLNRYNFNPLIASDFQRDPYDIWPITHRYPEDGSANTSDNTTDLTNTWESGSGHYFLAQLLRDMYQDCTVYADVATYSNDGKDGCGLSLESIHGIPHAIIGGQGDIVGHMNPPPYAAYDPAFMLHHSNVDRLFAFWQTLNPKSYSASQYASSEYNFAYGYNTTRNMSSPLYPFYKSSTKFWTGVDVRDWRVFNYDYPEYNRPGATRSASDIRTNIQHLYTYGTSYYAGNFTKRENSFVPTSAHKSFYDVSQQELEDEFHKRDSTESLDHIRAHPETGLLQRYTLKIQTPKMLHDNSGSFAHQFFFGEPANLNQRSTWASDANAVGQFFVFMGQMPATPHMEAVSEETIYSSVPLSDALAQRVADGKLASMLPEDVLPYLQKNLIWKISGTSGIYSVDDVAAGSHSRVPVVTLLHKEEEPPVAGQRSKVIINGQIAHFANQTALVADN